MTQGVRNHLLPPDLDPGASGPLRAFDLSALLIVAPTRQAARRLSEALVQQAAGCGAAILGARVVTPTFFLAPDPPDPRVASPTLAAALWSRVLLTLGPTEACTLFPPAARRTDYGWALQAGQLIQDVRQALSDGACSIADVLAQHGDALEERERWEDLALLERRYREQLAQEGHEDPITARIAHATQGDIPEGVERIVVASVTDPSLLVIAALRRAAQSLAVEILIHAPPTLADAFDAWGRPAPDVWQAREIVIPDAGRTLILAATPAAQSEHAVARLRTSSHPVALGVPDPAVTPFLAAACQDAGRLTFDPADRPFSRHPLFALVTGITDLAVDDAYTTLSALLRHADLLAALDAAGLGSSRHPFTPRHLLRELDTAQNLLLPESLTALHEGLDRAAAAAREPLTALRAALDHVALHLAGLRGEAPLAALRAFLQTLYRARRLDPRHEDDAEFAVAGEQLDQALRELEDAPAALLPREAAARFGLLRLRLSGIHYHPIPRHGALDLEGWLELPWSEAPSLIVTGMNEGAVPDTRRRDPFLPDPLRTRLGLRHDAARQARDACLMSALIASRPPGGSVTFLAGKVSATGDPLRPSRLLFRCADAELPARAALLFGAADAGRRSVPATVSFPLNSAPPLDLDKRKLPVKRLSVTALRDYLACPFRFYLGNVLDMQPLDDEASGLDARAFGTLTHAALQAMADAGMWRHDDPGALRGFLAAEARNWVHARFGAQPPLVVILALEAAQQRLGAAADRQVALVAEGWDLIASECKLTARLGDMELVGKIDRIDRHRESGRLRLIDYKTSDSATAPLQAHLKAIRPDTPEWQVLKAERPRRWSDLQLPLYAWLLREGTPPAGLSAADVRALPELGYFNLPKGVADTALSVWDEFSESDLRDAVRCAGEGVARISANCFWPPSPRVEHEHFEPLLAGDPLAGALPPFPEPAP